MMTMAQDGVRDATRTCDCPTRANTGWTTSPVRHRRDQIRMAMAGGRYWSLTGTRLGHWLGSLTYLLLRLGKIVHQTRGELVNKLALRISALPNISPRWATKPNLVHLRSALRVANVSVVPYKADRSSGQVSVCAESSLPPRSGLRVCVILVAPPGG